MRAVSERGPSAGGVVRVVEGDGRGVWLLVRIGAVENIFGTGGDVFGWWNGGSISLVRLCQKATAVPPEEDTDTDHEEEDSDDSTRESTLAYSAAAGRIWLLRIGYTLERFALCAGSIRMLESLVGREREMEYT